MSRTRTFVAVPLSDAQRHKLDRLRIELSRSLPDIKWTDSDNLHITLVFLGEVDDRELPDVCRQAQAAADAADVGAFTLGLRGLGCFPHERRPRVLWVGVETGATELAALHEALEAALEPLGYRREDRRFTAHVTLGRTKKDGPIARLAETLAAHRDWNAGECPVTEMHVMASQLSREGPYYTILGRANL
ncbi:MAG TPA: RNA 2',3'-cyclic phosphodiesterase [Gemmatales bacterium]|nr:RNA 2',3'-cyclic phosphodiesterase [Gemmatales bacterium]HMP59277.1 RNA 2',3'-cyclic phosphodiesterase [Gemmatales bacterium]